MLNYIATAVYGLIVVISPSSFESLHILRVQPDTDLDQCQDDSDHDTRPAQNLERLERQRSAVLNVVVHSPLMEFYPFFAIAVVLLLSESVMLMIFCQTNLFLPFGMEFISGIPASYARKATECR